MYIECLVIIAYGQYSAIQNKILIRKIEYFFIQCKRNIPSKIIIINLRISRLIRTIKFFFINKIGENKINHNWSLGFVSIVEIFRTIEIFRKFKFIVPMNLNIQLKILEKKIRCKILINFIFYDCAHFRDFYF